MKESNIGFADFANGGVSGYAPDSASLIDIQAVAKMLSCSTRSISRLTETGKIPAPVRVGSLKRWRKVEIEAWIEQGCPRVRPTSPTANRRMR